MFRWLRDLIWGRNPGLGDAREEESDGQPPEPASAGPRLALLVHDASAPSSYRLHTFEDAASAEGFVQFWFPYTNEHGILAFWTLHWEPAAQAEGNTEQAAEVVIMIRDWARPEIVYPFSMPDLELARSWLAKESARGLDLDCVLLYWAVPVKICRNRRGTVRLTPSEPPAARPPALLRSSTVIVRKEDTQEDEREASSPTVALPVEIDGGAVASPVEDASRVEESVEGPALEAGIPDEVADRLIRDALGEEARALMRKSRFQQQEGPFEGFGSPQGKF